VKRKDRKDKRTKRGKGEGKCIKKRSKESRRKKKEAGIGVEECLL
jgi:hypothetical protein